jgi:hypothetical protein
VAQPTSVIGACCDAWEAVGGVAAIEVLFGSLSSEEQSRRWYLTAPPLGVAAPQLFMDCFTS